MLECNTQTSRIYGEIKNQLRLKGRPLPENDIWIAAMSLQYNLILVTRNAHFQCLYS
ncbi:virulence associated protein C [Sphaerospermopsis reniformis]|uniref:Virulence associated protein C n=1 Tax=Sphaerospermopsis reniformis TaxID=531300 RepID=A0A479ZV35_9CYAN|nr:virulence associated protein C [Sphaerospermopsis reniformis]